MNKIEPNSLPARENLIIFYLRKPVKYSYKELYKAAFSNGKIQKKRGEPYAALIAFKDNNGEIRYGWSQCCKEDTFDKKLAVDMALIHATLSRNPEASLTHELKANLDEFKRRVEEKFARRKIK